MKKSTVIIGGITIVFFLFPVIFYSVFGIGMYLNSRPKPIKSEWVNNYKDLMRNEFSNIKDINIYYQQGHIYFDFDVDSKMNGDDCKLAVKRTKDFIVKQHDKGKYSEQLGIEMKFPLNRDIYEFECPYQIQTPNINDNPNETMDNNFKTWYMRINSNSYSKLEI